MLGGCNGAWRAQRRLWRFSRDSLTQGLVNPDLEPGIKNDVDVPHGTLGHVHVKFLLKSHVAALANPSISGWSSVPLQARCDT